MSSQRNLEIANLYVANPGYTLDRVGKIYSISKERVRQIVEQVYPEYSRPRKPKLSLEMRRHLRIQKRMDKFWDNCIENPSTKCWEWNLSKFPSGYGRFCFYGEQYAHRVSWIFTHGEISDGLHVLHRCDNPSCVNPAHLYLGTHADNLRDREDRFCGIPYAQRNKFITPKRQA